METLLVLFLHIKFLTKHMKQVITKLSSIIYKQFIILSGVPEIAIQCFMTSSTSFFLDLTTDAALNLVAWSIICNIRIPLIDLKSAAATLKSS